MKQKALKILESWMNGIRKDDKKIYVEIHGSEDGWQDPFKDVIIRKSTRMDTEYIKRYDANGDYRFSYTDIKLADDTDCICIEFEGEGFAWLSSHSEYGAHFRDQLDGKLRAAGFLMDDVFSWAANIVEA